MCTKHSGQTLRRMKGFTLLELMIVIAIISLLAGVAYPSYQNSVRKANRAVGKAALLELAGRQEQYFVNNKSYASDITDLQVAGAGLDNQGTFSATGTIYTVSIATNNTGTTYTLTLTPEGDQVNDSNCLILTLSNTGTKTASGSGGVAECW